MAQRLEGREAGTSGRQRMGAGTRELAAPTVSSAFPSLLALRFPGAPPPGHEAKERGRAEAEPAPASSPIGYCCCPSRIYF